MSASQRWPHVRPLWHGLAAAFLSVGLGAQGIPKQEAKLVSAGGALAGGFGWSCDISGDSAVIGNYPGPTARAFIRTGTSWVSEAELVPSGSATLLYGWRVAISDGTAVVTDMGADPNGITIHGPGAAYVFVRQGGTWSAQAKIPEPDYSTYTAFGSSVAIDGDTLVIGSPVASSVYVYLRAGSAWTQQAKLTGGIGMGEVVSISGDTIVAGGGANPRVFVRSGTNWTEQATLSTQSGSCFGRAVDVAGDTALIGSCNAAYLFTRQGNAWSQRATFTAPEPASDFGYAVAVSEVDGTALVGAPHATAGGHSNAGTAFVYVRTGMGWVPQGQLAALDPANNQRLGFAVALHGDTAVAGTEDAGAAYVFHPVQPWLKVGGGLAGVAGIPVLEGQGTLDAGSAGALTLTNAAPFALSVLFVSFASTPTPFKGGTLNAFPITFQLPVGTFFTGSWTLPWNAWPAGLPSGVQFYFQVAVNDLNAAKGVGISSLLRATQP